MNQTNMQVLSSLRVLVTRKIGLIQMDAVDVFSKRPLHVD